MPGSDIESTHYRISRGATESEIFLACVIRLNHSVDNEIIAAISLLKWLHDTAVQNEYP